MKNKQQEKRSFVEDDVLARWKDEDKQEETIDTLPGLNFYDNPLIEEQFIQQHKYTTEEI